MMSSIDSRPTDSLTNPGVTPVRLLLLGCELGVGGSCRLNHQAANVTNVR